MDSEAKARTSPAGIASVLIGGGQIIGYPVFFIAYYSFFSRVHIPDFVAVATPFILSSLGIGLALVAMKNAKAPSYAAHLGLVTNVLICGAYLTLLLATQY